MNSRLNTIPLQLFMKLYNWEWMWDRSRLNAQKCSYHCWVQFRGKHMEHTFYQCHLPLRGPANRAERVSWEWNQTNNSEFCWFSLMLRKQVDCISNGTVLPFLQSAGREDRCIRSVRKALSSHKFLIDEASPRWANHYSNRGRSKPVLHKVLSEWKCSWHKSGET